MDQQNPFKPVAYLLCSLGYIIASLPNQSLHLFNTYTSISFIALASHEESCGHQHSV